MDEKPVQKRRRTIEAKVKKHITVTPQGFEVIQQFADEQGISFSSAIESLALIGSGDNSALSLLPIITSQIHRTINSSFNRMAKLSAFSAIEAGQTKEITKMILLQDLRREQERDALLNAKRRHGDPVHDYEQRMRVDQGAKIRTTYGKMINKARMNTLTKLRSPLENIEEILNAEEAGDDE